MLNTPSRRKDRYFFLPQNTPLFLILKDPIFFFTQYFHHQYFSKTIKNGPLQSTNEHYELLLFLVFVCLYRLPRADIYSSIYIFVVLRVFESSLKTLPPLSFYEDEAQTIEDSRIQRTDYMPPPRKKSSAFRRIAQFSKESLFSEKSRE